MIATQLLQTGVSALLLTATVLGVASPGSSISPPC